jgi:hypothetical protein
VAPTRSNTGAEIPDPSGAVAGVVPSEQALSATRNRAATLAKKRFMKSFPTESRELAAAAVQPADAGMTAAANEGR